MIIDAIIKKKKNQPGAPAWKSLLKTISWRIIGTIDTVVISYLLTGTLKIAMSIGAIEIISKMVLYYFHERVWERFKTPAES
ncbi:MAG: DUF2061 domain-containing protein [Bacteroidota bacterium]